MNTETGIVVETWADGFGLWHVTVPDSGNDKANRRLARALILWELQQRAPAGEWYQIPAKAVPVVLVPSVSRTPGIVEYKEKSS